MYKHILVPVDGSAAAQQSLAHAAAIASALQATVRLFHVVDLYRFYMDPTGLSGTSAFAAVEQNMRQAGRDILGKARTTLESAQVHVEVHMAESPSHGVAELIVTQARHWHADLIVMGTHGRRGLRGLLLGSDAQSVLHLSHVPVLLVRADEAVPGDTTEE